MKSINRGFFVLDQYRAINSDHEGVEVDSSEDAEAMIVDCITDILTRASAHGHNIGQILRLSGIHHSCG